MEMKKQNAGDNAKQLQVGTLVVGIDEKRVREIVDEKLPIALQNFSEEAGRVAMQRNEQFKEKLIPKMIKEEALSAFADPSFQLLLTEAQKRAASTDRKPDYDLLSELMIHRFKKGENYNTRAGISRAVEIVDQISDEALLGLTVFYAASVFTTTSGNISEGFNILEHLFSILIYGDLPTGDEWLDHLDLLGAVRVTPLGGLRPFDDFFMEKLGGYCVGGIAQGSEEYSEMLNKMQSAGINNALMQHELANDEVVRLNIPSKQAIKKLSIFSPGFVTPINNEQIKILEEVYDLTNKTKIDKQKFIDEVEKRSSLKKVQEWWNDIHPSIQITGAGKVLAHANAQRINKDLPPLD